MKRKCYKLNVAGFLKPYPEIQENLDKIEIWIDEKNGKEILDLIFEEDNSGNPIRLEKWMTILHSIYSLKPKNELYGREDVSYKAKDVKAMKFKKHKGNNWRIYCKEYNLENKKIIMISSYDKKEQKISKKLKNKLETIGRYEYEFE